MAFISNKERNKLVKQTNRSFGWRKVFFFVSTLVAAAWFVIVILVAILGQHSCGLEEKIRLLDENDNLTATGWIFIFITAIMVVLLLVNAILMMCIKSPKKIIEMNKKLESSALSGKRTKGQKALKVIYERTKATKPKKSTKKGKK